MAGNTQDKEFTVFGIVSNALRARLIIGLLTLSITGNVLQFIMIVNTQRDLYNQMLERVDKAVDQKVGEKLDEPVQQIQQSVEKVNIATSQVDSVVTQSRNLINKQK